MNQAMAKAAILFAVFFLSRTLNAQTYSPPKTPTGQPDLQGIWQVQNTSNWDLESHAASHRSPAGFGVVVDPADGKIPYQPEAAERKGRTLRIARQPIRWKNAISPEFLARCICRIRSRFFRRPTR